MFTTVGVEQPQHDQGLAQSAPQPGEYHTVRALSKEIQASAR
jgi:hypothetical protein